MSSLVLTARTVQPASDSIPAQNPRFEAYRRVREEVAVQVRPIVERLLNESLDREVDALLGRACYQRVDLRDRTEVAAKCNQCGCQRRAQFRRGGHEDRTIATLYGAVQIRMPRIECSCGGLVGHDYLSVKRRARLWYDVRERIQELSAVAVSLRDTIELLAKQIAVGLRAANEAVNEAAELAQAERQVPLAEVPPVVLFDGLGQRKMEETGEVKVGRLGRRRKVKTRQRGMTLVAMGVWPQTGRKKVLAFEYGREEDEATCTALIARLEERGLRAERGLREVIIDGSKGFLAALEIVDLGPVVVQRCVFHKIRNLAENLEGMEQLTRPARQRLREEVLRDGAWVYRAQSKAGAYRRREQFCQKWGNEQPRVVESIGRDFEASVRYYDLQTERKAQGQNWAVQYLRSTSALERENRTQRHKRRQAGVFQSQQGLEASTWLVKERAEHHREKRPGLWIDHQMQRQLQVAA